MTKETNKTPSTWTKFAQKTGVAAAALTLAAACGSRERYIGDHSIENSTEQSVHYHLAQQIDHMMEIGREWQRSGAATFPRPPSSDETGADFFDKAGVLETLIRENKYTTALSVLGEIEKLLPNTKDSGALTHNFKDPLSNMREDLKLLSEYEKDGTLFQNEKVRNEKKAKAARTLGLKDEKGAPLTGDKVTLEKLTEGVLNAIDTANKNNESVGADYTRVLLDDARQRINRGYYDKAVKRLLQVKDAQVILDDISRNRQNNPASDVGSPIDAAIAGLDTLMETFYPNQYSDYKAAILSR